MNAWDIIAMLRLESGELWIDRAEDFQIRDAKALLEGPTPFLFATRPRGGSKTGDAAACSLAWVLTARPGARGFWAAADRDQAALAVDTIRGFLDRSPELQRRVEVTAHKVTCIASGASVEALAADAASSWGLRPELLVVDEMAWWSPTPGPKQFWESISSAVAKSKTARMVVITSPSAPGCLAHKVLEDARSSDLWMVSEQVGLVPWLDPARVAEQKRRLTPSMYQRLFEGRWTSGEDNLATLDAIRGCVTRDNSPLAYDRRHRYVVSLDLGLKRDRTVATVCHKEGAKVVLDRIAVWQGSRLKPVQIEAVEAWVEQAATSYGGAHVVVDPWQAVGLLQRLQGRGLKVEEFVFSSASTGRLAGTLYSLIRDRNLSLPDDPELIDELAHVRLVERSPGVYRLDHDSNRHDDRAVAVALAAQHLLKEPEYGRPSTVAEHPWATGARSKSTRGVRSLAPPPVERKIHIPTSPPAPPEPVAVGNSFFIRPPTRRS